MADQPIVIVGGGLAGLCCARTLASHDVAFVLLEADDRVGGRVRTDVVDGFLLDRGFQVLLTAYPECRAVLDYEALDLRRFEAGALVRRGEGFERLADPWRAPLSALGSLFADVGSLGDKLRVGHLRARVRRSSLEEIFARQETTTLAALADEGFSEQMIEAFFRPFLGGIFLDRELDTSSRMFEFVFKMFSEGSAAVPAGGMEEIPRQLVAALPRDCVRTEAPVAALEPGGVRLADGERIDAGRVVVAVDATTAHRLVPALPERRWRSTTCLYFAADEVPNAIDRPLLVLDGDGDGPINNLCVPSAVAPGYAPEGRSLISVTVVGETRDAAVLETSVRDQLRAWLGSATDGWRTLGAYEIPRALPSQEPGVLEPPHRPVRSGEGLYVCGDHLDTASIQGAMVSGRRAAEAVLADL